MIKNARLLERKGVSFEVPPGELVVLRSDAFNPVLTVEQLMKQALSRVHRETSIRQKRSSEEKGPIWQVLCDEISYAAETEAFRLSDIDQDELVEDHPNDRQQTGDSSSNAAIDELVSKLVLATETGGLVVVQARTRQISMSFRLSPEGASNKVSEVIGELTRDGASEADLLFKVFSPEIRSRQELETANPIVEFSLYDSPVDSIRNRSEAIFRSLDLPKRYRSGALKWARNSDARLLLVDTPRYLMAEKESTEFLDDLRQIIKPMQMCVVFEESSVGHPSSLRFKFTPDQLMELDKRLVDIRRKRDRLRLLDWTGGEVALADLFAVLPDARRNGLTAKDFIRRSTRYPCPVCSGAGVQTVSMGPFGDLQVSCTNCTMTGFSETVRQVKLGEQTFGDVLRGGTAALAEILKGKTELPELSVDSLLNYRLCDPLSVLSEVAILALVCCDM